MKYKIFKDGELVNTIVADEAFCEKYCSENGYTYEEIPEITPAPEKTTPAQQREHAYNTMPIIEWEGQLLTVTQAATKWQYYAAEGDTAKAEELTALISTAKQTIREQYPDKEGSA